MCFPGGACDVEDEGCEETALRETAEEIGVSAEHVRIVGYLDDMITISNFRVTPIVGFWTMRPSTPSRSTTMRSSVWSRCR